ncbi:MAG: DUF1788 domain-containing protein [Kiritimatiellae bacterium]|nr:DUF1788 domain-containing protein [Kiritimatiellia bacterium]
MQSLQQSFDELRLRLRDKRRLNHVSDDIVYYLIFAPRNMLAVKRLMKPWAAKLKLDGWAVETFSMADAVRKIVKSHGLRDIWLTSEADDPLDFKSINETLADALMAEDALECCLKDALHALKDCEKTIMFITDLEALHPYLRVGSLEQRLQGKFTVPTIILYPGIRAGKTTLKFLGFYPEDGNYRSTHIG